jgi:ribosomal protein L40E
MEESVVETRLDVCPRCLQAVPPKAQRCPHCGDPLARKANMPLLLAMLGLLMVVLIAFFAIRSMHSGGAVQPPPDDDGQVMAQPAPHPNPPPEPLPKPALGQ